MLEWLTDIWNKIMEIVNQVGAILDNLVTQLDSIQFNEDFIISKWLGTIHYIVGTPLYIMFTTLLIIGAGFILWKLIKIVINSLAPLIPGLKGKIKVE